MGRVCAITKHPRRHNYMRKTKGRTELPRLLVCTTLLHCTRGRKGGRSRTRSLHDIWARDSISVAGTENGELLRQQEDPPARRLDLDV